MICDKFTIEDIHQIRYENYERQKNMTAEEKIEDTKKGAVKIKKRLAELKISKRGY